MATQSLLNPHTTLQAASDTNINGLEFFGLIRQAESPDVIAEY